MGRAVTGNAIKTAMQRDLEIQNTYRRRSLAVFSALMHAYGADKVPEYFPPLRKYMEILDLGTGEGLIGPLLKARFKQAYITGAGESLENLQIAQEKRRIDRARKGRVTDLGWSGDGQFDVVVSIGALDSIKKPERLVAEAMRVAMDGGVVAVTYEPKGAHRAGNRTAQHDGEALKTLFKKHNASEIMLQGHLRAAYFDPVSQRPVDNDILIVAKAFNFHL